MSLSHFESHLSHLGTDFCIPPQEFVVERFGSDVVIARKLFGWLGGIGDPLQVLLHPNADELCERVTSGHGRGEC